MSEVVKFLEHAMYVLMFCLAVTLFIKSSTALELNIVQVKRTLNNALATEQYVQEREPILEKEEIISLLLEATDYDILVNGVPIPKGYHTGMQIAEYPIPDGDYRKQYQYNPDGTITVIQFEQIR